MGLTSQTPHKDGGFATIVKRDLAELEEQDGYAKPTVVYSLAGRLKNHCKSDAQKLYIVDLFIENYGTNWYAARRAMAASVGTFLNENPQHESYVLDSIDRQAAKEYAGPPVYLGEINKHERLQEFVDAVQSTCVVHPVAAYDGDTVHIRQMGTTDTACAVMYPKDAPSIGVACVEPLVRGQTLIGAQAFVWDRYGGTKSQSRLAKFEEYKAVLDVDPSANFFKNFDQLSSLVTMSNQVTARINGYRATQ